MIDKCKELAAYARSIRSRIIATILLAVFCAGTVFAAATASYTVTVVDDGQARSVITTRSDANAILEQAKVEIGADDKSTFPLSSAARTARLQFTVPKT